MLAAAPATITARADPVSRSEPLGRPSALTEGYEAAILGTPATSNPYALGLPSDSESLALLWVDGYTAASRPHDWL